LKNFVTRSLFCFAVASLISLTSVAQQAPSANAPASQPSQADDHSKDAPDQTSPQQNPAPSNPAPSAQAPASPGASSQTPANPGTSKDRLFFALPNFLTVENGAKVPPLTTGQKFKVVTRSAFDYVQIPWYALLAGIGQAENSEPGYGQGSEGYAKRFGSDAADGIIENYMVQAVVPSLLHQDPRFFQLSEGGFWHRTEYAVSRIVVTRTDSGHHQFNFSEVFGSAAAAAISTYSYHPSADRTLSNTASVWGTQMGYDTITLVIKEFWPDIRRKLKKNPPTDTHP
jgi:hypothetical protein